jgi:ubiquinol-cytochrome c reductase cytochrome b subunit
MPVVGPLAATFLQGGRTLGTLSITRLNAVHTALLPLLTLLVIAAHVALVRRTGPTPPASVPLNALPRGATEADIEAARARGIRVDRYWPAQAARDALAALAVVAAVYYLARRHGAPLTAPADPSGDFPARPEWYLLALFKLRKYFEGPKEILATVVIPGAVSTFFVLLPLIDRAPTRALRARVPYVAGAYACVLFVAGLTVMSVRSDARDATYQQALRLSERRAARAMQLAAMGVPPEGPLEMVRNDPQVRPRELFTELCASCHAENGAPLHEANGHRSAARGPSLQGFGSRAWLRSMLDNPDADDLFGRTNIHDMPSQATRLGPDGMNAVVEYLYGQSVEQGDPPADAALALRGDEIYHRRCTQCHQGAGDQSETPPEDRDAPDLTGWGSRAWIRAQIVNAAKPENYGSRNEMPAFGERLAGRELEWVVDYVRGLRARTAPEVPPPPPRAQEGSGS